MKSSGPLSRAKLLPPGHPVLQKVLLILRFLATGSFQRAVAEVLEVSQSSASCCLDSFLDTLLANLQYHLNFPTEEREQAAIWVGFVAFAGFLNALKVPT